MWLQSFFAETSPALTRASVRGERTRVRSPSLFFAGRSSGRFIAALVAVLLVLAQQTAFTHLISHLGDRSVSAQTITTHEDRDHQTALSLTHNCATCVAVAALGGPPSALFAFPLAAAVVAVDFAVPATHAPAAPTRAYRARAPPRTL